MTNVSKTADDVAKEQGLPLEQLDKPITKAAAIRLAKHCNPWNSVGRAILQSFQDVKDIEEHYHNNQQRREKILECAHEQGVPVRKLVSALLENKQIVAAGKVCKEIKEMSRNESDGPVLGGHWESPGNRRQPPLRMIGVVIFMGFFISGCLSAYMWHFYGTKDNHIKPQDHSYHTAPQPTSQYGDHHNEGSIPEDSVDICKGQPEMEERDDKPELSKIIGTNGDWKEWCTYLGVDEGSCNSIEHSRDPVTVRSLDVAQAYLHQLNTCWKKVVLILCTKLIKPNCKAARDVAKKHGIDYTTICTCP